jgi:hypothetical protein
MFAKNDNAAGRAAQQATDARRMSARLAQGRERAAQRQAADAQRASDRKNR